VLQLAKRRSGHLHLHSTRSSGAVKLIGYACRHPDPPLRKAYLPLNDLTVLLGPNDSGKSSLLQAVERDLSGGHFDHVDEELKTLIGGVFYTEVSKDELWAIAGTAVRTRDEQRSEYGTRSQGRRPPWDDGLWNPPRDGSSPIDPDQLIEHLQTPSRKPVLDALKDSHIIGIECVGRNDMGHRVWNVYWCLPALATLEQSLREAVEASDLPFMQRRRAGRNGLRLGMYAALHGNAGHLCIDAAPLPVVALGPFVDLPMPTGLAVPADFDAIHQAVDRGITRLVEVVRHCRRDVTLDGDHLPPEEKRERESPRGWVETDEENVYISRAAYAAAEFLSATATRLMPDFVSDIYEVEIHMHKLDAWLQEAPFEIMLRRRSEEGMASPYFPIARAADGHRLWLQLALLDALEHIGPIEALIWERATEAFEAERELSNIPPDDTDALQAQSDHRDGLDRRLQDVLDAFCGTEFSESDPGGELGVALTRPPSDEWFRGGKRERRFFLVDEPERHLHPRLQRAAAAWLARTTAERQAPCLIASHSAPFLGLSGESTGYVYVARHGEQINPRPVEPSELGQLDEVSTALGFDRGELLTLVNLWLVVEGATDKAVLDTLFTKELHSAGIEVVPIHGVAKWKAVLDSEALWRFTTAPVAVMFDQVPAERVYEMSEMSPDELLAISRSRESEEVKTLALLLGNIVRQGKAIEPVPNAQPDILRCLDENAVKAVFPKYPGHKEAEDAWDRHHKGKRTDFLRRRYGVEKDSVPFREIAQNMLSRGVESIELAETIKRCTELAQSGTDTGHGTAP
jgi:hypothetical protein